MILLHWTTAALWIISIYLLFSSKRHSFSDQGPKSSVMGFKGIRVRTGRRLMSKGHAAPRCSTLQRLQLGIMPSCLQRGNSSMARWVSFKGSLQRDNSGCPTVTVSLWHLRLNIFIKSFWCADRGAKMQKSQCFWLNRLPTAPSHLTLPQLARIWWERFSTYLLFRQPGWVKRRWN